MIGDVGTNAIMLLPGASDGTFGAAVTVPINQPVNSVAVGDFNHDGKLDLLATVGSTTVRLSSGRQGRR